MLSASYADFQIPNTPGLAAGTSPNGNPWLPGTFNSSSLNENQNEQNYYGVVTYQKAAGKLELSGFIVWPEQQRAFHARPDRRPVLRRRGSDVSGIFIPAVCRPMPVLKS